MDDRKKTKAQLVEELTALRRRLADLESRPGGDRRVDEILWRQNGYLAALHEISLALMQRREISDLLEAIIVWAGRLLDTSHGYIYLLMPGAEELEIKF